jgi:hypothetical protein
MEQRIAKPPQGRTSSGNDAGEDNRGSKERPLVVDTKGHQDSPAEAAEAKAEQQYQRDIERRTLYLAGIASYATIALVVIGLGGVCAAIWTLLVIQRQTNHMVNSERAWLIIPKPPEQRLSPLTSLNQFTFSLVNKGRTIARVMDFDSKFMFLERGSSPPSIPVYSPREPHNLTHLHGYAMAVDDPFNDIGIAIDEWLEVDRLRDLRDGQLCLYAYGRINYVDFSKETRTIQFCYRFVPQSNPDNVIEQVGLGGQWMLYIPPDAPAAYNFHT